MANEKFTVGTKIDVTTAFAKHRKMNVNEALQVLKMSGYKMMSWGAHAFTNINDYALRFMVNGHHHKGHVYVCLNSLDYYEVILTSSQGTIKEHITDIGVEDLSRIIDEKVEKIDAYIR